MGAQWDAIYLPKGCVKLVFDYASRKKQTNRRSESTEKSVLLLLLHCQIRFKQTVLAEGGTPPALDFSPFRTSSASLLSVDSPPKSRNRWPERKTFYYQAGIHKIGYILHRLFFHRRNRRLLNTFVCFPWNLLGLQEMTTGPLPDQGPHQPNLKVFRNPHISRIYFPGQTPN